MKMIIFMAIFSIIYLVAMDVITKRISNIDFGEKSEIVSKQDDSSYYNVKITGAVVNPGTYTTTKGATLGYLIALAGGVSENADALSYNSNAILVNNATYYISKVLDDGSKKISINKATVAELDTLPGVGSVLAKRIVAYRGSNGDFNLIEDITKVSGIGSVLFEQIKDLICL